MNPRAITAIHPAVRDDIADLTTYRALPTQHVEMVDPFLFLNHHGPQVYAPHNRGLPFGPHPHRGFETVTYMLDGRMRHKDNHGNEGLMTPGSVQWMTAGRGIVHSEMPEQEEGLMRGFQLWVNLPAKDKMGAPKYQEFAPDRIPEVELGPGVRVKVIAGRVAGTRGPVEQPATDPIYLDVSLAAESVFEYGLPVGHTAFAYVYEGEITVDATAISPGELLVFGAGDRVRFDGRAVPSRFILVAGRPIGEPVARYGPFVMNTQAEIMQAVQDFQAGRF